MKSEQKIIARIKYLHDEHECIKELQLIEYSIVGSTANSGVHIRTSGDRIMENEVKIRHILEKIRLLEWCIDDAES